MELFTQAEGVAWNTTDLTCYDLEIHDADYELFVNQSQIPVSRPLRNYTSFTGSIDPYGLQNFLFFGDNTTRGESRVTISYLSVTMPSQLPEDFNGDGLVYFSDFVAFSNAFGMEAVGDHALFDLDGSGSVNFSDFVSFSIAFNTQTTTARAVPEPSVNAWINVSCTCGAGLPVNAAVDNLNPLNVRWPLQSMTARPSAVRGVSNR